MGVHPAARDGYRVGADAYRRARPSYPDAAVDWLLGELGAVGGDEIVELGAGTGKFTGALVARGFRVVAVEPVAAMREQLAATASGVVAVDAAAEKLPFDSGSVGHAVASQSLHWADVGLAFAELDRVLSTEGAIGLIWNFRDVGVAWQRDLDALLASLRGDAPHSRDGRWQRAAASSAFEVVSERTWRWSLDTDLEGVLDRVRSVSYVAALAPAAQAEVEGRVREFAARHGLPERIAFPYVTEAYVLRRRRR